MGMLGIVWLCWQAAANAAHDIQPISFIAFMDPSEETFVRALSQSRATTAARPSALLASGSSQKTERAPENPGDADDSAFGRSDRAQPPKTRGSSPDVNPPKMLDGPTPCPL